MISRKVLTARAESSPTTEPRYNARLFFEDEERLRVAAVRLQNAAEAANE